MSAPSPIDISELKGPWAGLTLSGVTASGSPADTINGNFRLGYDSGVNPPSPIYTGGGSGLVTFEQSTPGMWQILLVGSPIFTATTAAAWPWEVTTWNANGSPAGTVAIAYYLPPPEALIVPGTEQQHQAYLFTTSLDTNANARGNITAVPMGRIGNSFRYCQVNPGANNATASVVVNGLDITVNLATGSGGAITTTGTQRNALIAASPAASAMITAVNYSTDTGAGIVSAFAFTNLSNGVGGQAPAPVPIPV